MNLGIRISFITLVFFFIFSFNCFCEKCKYPMPPDLHEELMSIIPNFNNPTTIIIDGIFTDQKEWNNARSERRQTYPFPSLCGAGYFGNETVWYDGYIKYQYPTREESTYWIYILIAGEDCFLSPLEYQPTDDKDHGPPENQCPSK